MKILKANAGPLTNFEVLDFLRSRGAGKDPTPVIAPIAPSEFKIVEDCDRCIGEDAEELVEMVLQVFPTPTQMESDKGSW